MQPLRLPCLVFFAIASMAGCARRTQPLTSNSEAAPDFEFYIASNHVAVIVDYVGTGSTIRIPSRIAKYPVTCLGTSCRNNWLSDSTQLILSASITNIENTDSLIDYCHLTCITVDAGNPEYSSRDGMLFNHDQTVLIRCPNGRTGSVTIPPAVTNIWRGALRGKTYGFSFTNRLANISVAPGNTHFRDIDGVLFDATGTVLLQYPCSRTTTSYNIPDGVTKIDAEAFRANRFLKQIILPASVTRIGDQAFAAGNRQLEVQIPNSVTNISASAFDSSCRIRRTMPGDKVE